MGRKCYHTTDAPDGLTAAVSLLLITPHVITADITATTLELLSKHHQLEVNVGGRSYVLKKKEDVSATSLCSTVWQKFKLYLYETKSE